MFFVKSWLRRLLPETWVDRVSSIRRHQHKHGHMPALLFPRSFNDKVLHRILFDRRPILATLLDKATARDFVASRLGPQVLPRLYHSTADPETIVLEDLPERFVVKPTHGSGWVRVVRDRSLVDRAELMETCKSWLRQNYYDEGLEWGYKHITPRILVEEFIDDGHSGAPNDYKFLVFGGVVRLIDAHTGRGADHLEVLYSREWKRFDAEWGCKISEDGLPRPPHLAQMIAAAESLAGQLDFMRVDFYDTPDQFYFGEFTPTPGNGWCPFQPESFDTQLGSYWKLPPMADLRGREPA